MIRITLLISSISCLFLFCAETKLAGKYNEDTYTFKEPDCYYELKLPSLPGWEIPTEKNPEKDIIFEARNTGKILYVFLAAESLNSDIEDYFLLLKLSNKLEQQEGYRLLEKSIEKVNGEPCLQFVYSAEISDNEIGTQNFTYTNALFKKHGINYRLMVYTLTDAYQRKKELINSIIHGFYLKE